MSKLVLVVFAPLLLLALTVLITFAAFEMRWFIIPACLSWLCCGYVARMIEQSRISVKVEAK